MWTFYNLILKEIYPQYANMKLYYFDVYGKAEQIRMLLDHAKQPFEEDRYSFEQWAVAKNTGPFEFK